MNNFERFLAMANRGKYRGASPAEIGARKLALAFLEHGLTFDDRTLAGFVEFCQTAKLAPESVSNCIEKDQPLASTFVKA